MTLYLTELADTQRDWILSLYPLYGIYGVHHMEHYGLSLACQPKSRYSMCLNEDSPDGRRDVKNKADPPMDDLRTTLPQDFCLLSAVIPDILCDIRYYTTYNFIGDRIDGYLAPAAWLTTKAASALTDIAVAARSEGYRLLVYDAYRPQRAVDHFTRWADDADDIRMKPYFYPKLEKQELFPRGYILRKSAHSRGSTLDLSLFDVQLGCPVDMGSPFDFFGQRSHADYTGQLSHEQLANRARLREFMTTHGFVPLTEEWWHFTLKDEPYPTTYFDAPVTWPTHSGIDAPLP